MKVVLEVPEDLDVQFVYRMIRKQQFETEMPRGFKFFYLNSPSDALPHKSACIAAWGLPAYLKILAKLASKSRSLYIVLHDESLASFGWCNLGFCKHYRLEPDALMIGPIETFSQFQSRGLGSIAMMQAINLNLHKSISIFYIDTQRTNIPAQKAFLKCGFGEPFALYLR